MSCRSFSSYAYCPCVRIYDGRKDEWNATHTHTLLYFFVFFYAFPKLFVFVNFSVRFPSFRFHQSRSIKLLTVTNNSIIEGYFFCFSKKHEKVKGREEIGVIPFFMCRVYRYLDIGIFFRVHISFYVASLNVLKNLQIWNTFFRVIIGSIDHAATTVSLCSNSLLNKVIIIYASLRCNLFDHSVLPLPLKSNLRGKLDT